jgi:hypothetical protein
MDNDKMDLWLMMGAKGAGNMIAAMNSAKTNE